MNDCVDWSYTVAAQTDILPDRGFTGHEYLPWFKLYNMNGRLYDPVVGRFLEPDPIIQDASSTQNLNRYSYCLNNPLKYTDPSGYRMAFVPGEGDLWIDPNYRNPNGGRGTGYSQPGFGAPGFGNNGKGQNGTYYDYYSNSYRSTSEGNPAVGWEYGYKVSSSFGITAKIISGFDGNFSFRGLLFKNHKEWYTEDGIDALIGIVMNAHGDEGYQNQYGDPSTSLASFRDHYSGMPLNQIASGESSFLGYKFPNYVDPAYRFVNICNGRQVDMTHFLVVGPRGHIMGVGNEIKQIFSHPESAFYPQDLYSNRLGVNFFNSYGPLIQQNPNNISTYIYWFLSNPSNINFVPINFNWVSHLKY